MSRTCPSILQFSVSVVLIGFLNSVAQADLIVGGTEVPFPPALGPEIGGMEGPPLNEDHGDFDENGYTWDSSNLLLRVRNTAVRTQTKQAWLLVYYKGTAPQNAGEPFDSSKWPTIGGFPVIPGTPPIQPVATPTAVSAMDVGDGETAIWMTWEIDPQPAEETIDFSNLGLTFAADDVIEFKTRCVPEPTTVALLFIGTLLMINRLRSSTMKS